MSNVTPVFLHGYSGEGSSLNEFASLCFPNTKPICIDLPGFGNNPLKNTSAETDPKGYLEETWQTIRREVPNGQIHLVGHSYGAMLAFALAAAHPNDVTRVDLFNPGVYPKVIPRLFLYIIAALKHIPSGLRVLVWLMKRRVFVDLVTRTMEYKDWPSERKAQIRQMRRDESRAYTPQMLALSLHALRMPKALADIHCSVPVRMVHSRRDTITKVSSCAWLAERSDDASILETYGGHLGLVAEPERWAALLYR